MTHEEKQEFLNRESYERSDLSTFLEILSEGFVDITARWTEDTTEFEKNLDKQLALEVILRVLGLMV